MVENKKRKPAVFKRYKDGSWGGSGGSMVRVTVRYLVGLYPRDSQEGIQLVEEHLWWRTRRGNLLFTKGIKRKLGMGWPCGIGVEGEALLEHLPDEECL